MIDNSAFVLADVSVRSPWKKSNYVMTYNIYKINVSQKKLMKFWNKITEKRYCFQSTLHTCAAQSRNESRQKYLVLE